VENRKFLTLPGLELRPLSRPASSHYKTKWLILFSEIIVVYFENKKENILFHYLNKTAVTFYVKDNNIVPTVP
jgi:hypothetical protein